MAARGTALSLAIAASLTVSHVGQAQLRNVELELVLAIDTSTSVNADEYELQRTGLARAFRSANVQSAIASLGEQGIAVAVVQWAGPGQQRLAVDWTWMKGPQGAERFAEDLSAMPRAVSGFTDIAGAITHSMNQILTNNYVGDRLAIDVSGDGTSDENDPIFARDRALAQGITINGLAIHSDEYDLGDLAQMGLVHHYTTRVIGGPGHFLIQASDFDDFARAIEKKLVREIIGPAFAER
ncbi:DUF1194 domain-containing protein [Pseudahrensia aquimaris]|uniref:DUF1194 domain-containing protein n=1 Tax=Pseudahrensia aquimaris TaxID=744461 RepID=A0ABW3FE57_9HYPH